MIVCSPILLLAAANALARHAGCQWITPSRRGEVGKGGDGARFVQLAGFASHYDATLGVSSWPLRPRPSLAQLLAPLIRARLLLDEGDAGDFLIALDRHGTPARVGIVLGAISRRRPAAEPAAVQCDVLWGEIRNGGRIVAVRQRGWFGAASGYQFSPWYILAELRREQARRAA